MSCQKEGAQQIVNNPQFVNVDSRLTSYFRQFEREAASRGLEINIAQLGITAEITNIPEEHVAGQCNFNNRTPNHIIIDEQFFASASPLFNEFIIYHELGHCILNRDHEESRFQNGTCVSIMRSGLGSCRDNYSTATRETYIDELFSVD